MELMTRVAGVLSGTPHPHPSPRRTPGKLHPSLDPHPLPHLHVSSAAGWLIFAAIAALFIGGLCVVYASAIREFIALCVRWFLAGCACLGIITIFALVIHFTTHYW